MLPIDTLLCPCCAPIIFHTLAQSATGISTQHILELGKGALLKAIARETAAKKP